MINIQTYNSPLGTIYLQSQGKYLTGLSFNRPQTDISKLLEQSTPILEETKHWLDIYFQGIEPDFVPLYKLSGLTPFREQVTQIMCRIPYGKTVTYGKIAQEMAEKRGLARMSAQAIGGAVGANPICLIIPCHRVMGADGKLTGYGGGIQRKIELLKLEGYPII